MNQSNNDWPTAAVIMAGILAFTAVLIWAPPSVSGPVVMVAVIVAFLLFL